MGLQISQYLGWAIRESSLPNLRGTLALSSVVTRIYYLAIIYAAGRVVTKVATLASVVTRIYYLAIIYAAGRVVTKVATLARSPFRCSAPDWLESVMETWCA